MGGGTPTRYHSIASRKEIALHARILDRILARPRTRDSGSGKIVAELEARHRPKRDEPAIADGRRELGPREHACAPREIVDDADPDERPEREARGERRPEPRLEPALPFLGAEIAPVPSGGGGEHP